MQRSAKILLMFLAVILGFSGWNIWHRVSAPRQLALVRPGGFVPLPDGTLVRSSAGTGPVYYIEKGAKRGVDSDETFRIQGFQVQNVQSIDAGELIWYPDGDPVTAQSQIIMPGEEYSIPDLAPFPAKDIRLASVNGRTVLRFTARILNRGRTPLELDGDPQINGDSFQDVRQHIVRTDGTVRDKIVGNFYWHVPHNHYHYSDFVDYVLEKVEVSTDIVRPNVPGTQQKTSFCLRDDSRVAPELPNSPAVRMFSTCSEDHQGISVGWVDVYASTLPDQFIDVQDLPPGVYRLSFFVDPRQRFVEMRKDNNISSVLLDLDVARGLARVIAAGAPFSTPENHYPDGMLLRPGGQSQVYVVHNDRRRWLRTLEIFDSYGYSWASVYALPSSMVDTLARVNLVRVAGTTEVYALNDLGYKRRVLDLNVLASYGLTERDISDINTTEFQGYPDTRLIQRASDDQVYEISSNTKRLVGTLGALSSGYDQASIHVVDQADFDSYVLVQ